MLQQFKLLSQSRKNFLSLTRNYLDNPKGMKLSLLNKFFNFLIPFNTPHGLFIQQYTENEVKVKLPFKKTNLNHVKSIHACAIATLGEFSAGLLITKNFNMENYRLILAKLEITYKYQGKTDLIAMANLRTDLLKSFQEEVRKHGVGTIQLETNVHDLKRNHVADIHSTWQIKEWDKVKTK